MVVLDKTVKDDYDAMLTAYQTSSILATCQLYLFCATALLICSLNRLSDVQLYSLVNRIMSLIVSLLVIPLNTTIIINNENLYTFG
jgi:hypothetical protein